MTPTAVTPAARTKRRGAGAPTNPRADRATTVPRGATTRAASPHPTTPRSAHRAPLQRSSAPRAPRRVSGPTAPPARRTAVRTPRQPRQLGTPLRVRALATLRTLPDHSLLDRIVRGRWWIPLLGVLLAGIVATQVEVLKLNASIGHSVVRASALAGENQALRAQISEQSDAKRTEIAAERYGMQMPAATQPLFLSAGGATTLPRAMRDIHSPDPSAFAAQTSATATTRANDVVDSSGE